MHNRYMKNVISEIGNQTTVQKMAASLSYRSPGISKIVERILDDGQYSGEIILSSRNLKEYPLLHETCDILDTTLIGEVSTSCCKV